MSFRYISEKKPLILASASPRRRELLEQVKIPFTVLPGHIDENSENGAPCDICKRLSERKALYVYNPSNKRWILGADTVVVKNEEILNKPADADEAKYMLNRLSNGDHYVITGFSIVDPSGHVAETDYVSTTVSFKQLTDEEIDSYVKTGEPFGKAGAYAIQGIGSFMIKSISGSYSNVVGLPLFAIIYSLKRHKAIERFPLI